VVSGGRRRDHRNEPRRIPFGEAPKVEHRRVVPWTVTQVRAIADAHPDRYRALVVLAAGTGLRHGERSGSRSATSTSSGGQCTSGSRSGCSTATRCTTQRMWIPALADAGID
jgi:hypothetical protein